MIDINHLGVCDELLCDFCGRPVAVANQRRVLGRAVDIRMDGPGMHLDVASDPEWCACPACHELLTLGAWDLLVYRVMMAMGFPNDKPMELLLRATYSKAFGCDCLSSFARLNLGKGELQNIRVVGVQL